MFLTRAQRQSPLARDEFPNEEIKEERAKWSCGTRDFGHPSQRTNGESQRFHRYHHSRRKHYD